jgi:hypothetical protein
MGSNVLHAAVPKLAGSWARITAQTVRRVVVPGLLGLLLFAAAAKAQLVRVDATPGHATNSFSPPYALGTTVDRVPSNATDIFFRPDQLKQVLSAGWGTVSYRQNTELFVQGIGIPKAGGVIHPAKGTSAEVRFRPPMGSGIRMAIRCSIVDSPETAGRNSTVSPASMTAISIPTGRAIPISQNHLLAKTIRSIRNGW